MNKIRTAFFPKSCSGPARTGARFPTRVPFVLFLFFPRTGFDIVLPSAHYCLVPYVRRSGRAVADGTISPEKNSRSVPEHARVSRTKSRENDREEETFSSLSRRFSSPNRYSSARVIHVRYGLLKFETRPL